MARRNGFGCLDLLSRPARNSLSAGSTRLIVVAIGTTINAVDEFPVAFDEIERGELELGLPAQVVKDPVLRFTGKAVDAEKDQFDVCYPRIGVEEASQRPFPG